MLLPSCKFQNGRSVHIEDIIRAALRRCVGQFIAVLCKTCSGFIVEQLRVGTGTNWFRIGPAYDIIKHVYLLSN